ncbi:MAG: PAS domain S-box protein [Candidatus Aminicenantia bacterium]
MPEEPLKEKLRKSEEEIKELKKGQPEKALKSSQMFLKSVIENVPLVLFAVDRDLIFTLSEGQGLKALGLKPGEVVGRSVMELYGDVPEIIESLKKALKGDSVHRIIKVGQLIYDTYYQPHRDKNGKVQGIIGVAVDITERKKMEEELRESERRFKNLIETSPDIVFRLSKEGFIEYVSPRVEELYGYPPDELIGKHLKKTTPIGDVPKALKALRTVLKGNNLWNFRINQRDKKGNIIPMEINAVPIEKKGKIIGLQGIMRDITERKRTEEALQLQKAYFQSLFEYSPESVVTLNQNLLIENINPMFTKLFGYTIEEAKGKDINKLIVPTERMDEARKFDKSALKGIISAETIRKKKDGTKIPVSLLAGPIYIEDQAIGYFAIYRDITERVRQEEERKRTLEEIQVERDKFKAIITSIGEGLNIINQNYRIEFQNKFLKERFGDAKGKFCYEVYMNFKEPCSFCPMIKAIKTKQTERVELQAADGHYYETTSSPFTDLDGKTKVVEIVRDITEKKSIEEELLQSERLSVLGELIAGIAHELNNPLTTVIGYSEFLLSTKPDEDKLKERLKKINTEAERCYRIVQSLLDIARKHPPEKQYVDLNEVVEKSVEIKHYELKVDNIEVKKELDPSLPRTMAERHRIQQAILNLLNNAHDAIVRKEQKGKITVETGVRDSKIFIKISDNGPGIPRENLSKIFIPFFTTKKGPVKGTGLGLSIVQRIINEHDGRISISSEEGEGTTFTLELPIVKLEEITKK